MLYHVKLQLLSGPCECRILHFFGGAGRFLTTDRLEMILLDCVKVALFGANGG